MGSGSYGTVWLTGLSGAGKSTIASGLHDLLSEVGIVSYLLDGDDLRNGLNSDLGFADRDRAENVRRMGEVAVLFARSGCLTIVSAISPFAVDREKVRRRHQDLEVRFAEIHVTTHLGVCESRDPKGLYARARRGELLFFTGVSHPYEIPESPELALNTFGSPMDSVLEVFKYLKDAAFITDPCQRASKTATPAHRKQQHLFSR